MTDIVSTPIFTVFSFIIIFETLKTLLLGTVGAYQRKLRQVYLNQEDAAWLGGDAVSANLPDPSARICRAHRNNLENLLPFAVLGFLYLLIGANPSIGIGYFTLFVIGRTGHTYAYLNAKPMFRRNMYSVAWLAMVVMALHIVAVLFKRLM